jgi:hypothetical protein
MDWVKVDALNGGVLVVAPVKMEKPNVFERWLSLVFSEHARCAAEYNKDMLEVDKEMVQIRKKIIVIVLLPWLLNVLISIVTDYDHTGGICGYVLDFRSASDKQRFLPIPTNALEYVSENSNSISDLKWIWNELQHDTELFNERKTEIQNRHDTTDYVMQRMIRATVKWWMLDLRGESTSLYFPYGASLRCPIQKIICEGRHRNCRPIRIVSSWDAAEPYDYSYIVIVPHTVHLLEGDALWRLHKRWDPRRDIWSTVSTMKSDIDRAAMSNSLLIINRSQFPLELYWFT